MTLKCTLSVALLLFLGACGTPTPSATPAASPVAASDAAAGPWPGWVSLGNAQRAAANMARCSESSQTQWALGTDSTGHVMPQVANSKGVASRWDPLPVSSAQPELTGTPAPGTQRRVIDEAAGWLVALDAGEFGGGLYSLDKTSNVSSRLDAQLPEEIRWVERFDFGIVGVSGLCHGEGCARTTRVYRIKHAANGWEVARLAQLNGCPGSIVGQTGGTEALLLTCHALHSITASGVVPIATWSQSQYPLHGSAAAARDATGAAYVSFGPVIAKFSPDSPSEWFATTSWVSRTASSPCR